MCYNGSCGHIVSERTRNVIAEKRGGTWVPKPGIDDNDMDQVKRIATQQRVKVAEPSGADHQR